jgi:glucose/arabinose dehydrogenase
MNRGSLVTPVAVFLGAALLSTGCSPQTVSDTSRDAGTPSTTSATSASPGEVAPSGAPQVPNSTQTIIPPDSSTNAPEPTEPAEPAGTAKGSVKVIDTVATDIPVPWGLAKLPDGTVLVTSRDEHHLYRVAPKAGKVVDLGEIPGVDSDGGEGGLLGVAVSKYYAENKRIFLYFSTATDNRIATVTLLPGSPASVSEPKVIFSGIPRGFRHNGGRIAFGPDEMLYVSTGETEVPALSQDKSSLGGKILRMTPKGKPAPGNPFKNSVVYSYGHRNVQGLTFDSQGRLFASEFGDKTADELNWIRPGRNYGWPASQGSTDLKGVTNPIAEFGTDEDSPSGIALAGGSVYMAALQGQRLWRIPLDGTKLVAEPRSFLIGEFGRLRSVIALNDTELLVSTSNTDGRISPRPGDDRLLLVRVS